MKYIILLFLLLGFNGCFFYYVKEPIVGEIKPIPEDKKVELSTEIELKKMTEYLAEENRPDRGAEIMRNEYKETFNGVLGVIEKKLFASKGVTKSPNSDYNVKLVGLLRSPYGESSSLSWLGLLTFGVIPWGSSKKMEFEVEVYYKKELIKKYNYYFEEGELDGWLTIPANLIITPFVPSFYAFHSSKIKDQPRILDKFARKIASDALDDFNIEPTIVEDTKPNAPTRVEIFRGGVFGVSGNHVTINFKQRAGLRPGLLVFYQDASGKVVSTGKVTEINFTNAKASFAGTAPTKGLDVVAFKEVYQPSKK